MRFLYCQSLLLVRFAGSCPAQQADAQQEDDRTDAGSGDVVDDTGADGDVQHAKQPRPDKGTDDAHDHGPQTTQANTALVVWITL